MTFSSMPFLLGFFPTFFLIYYLIPDRGKNLVLLLGSLTFYFIGSLEAPEHFILFLLSILMDFILGCQMEKQASHRKAFFVTGVAVHVAVLFFFKYSNFLISEYSRLTGAAVSLQILLPLGISFYTFQGISYLADVYRRKTEPEQSLLRFAVYISMFEQLIAGPIVTYGQVKNSLAERKVTAKNAVGGLETFILGLGMKVLLANPLGKLFTQIRNIGFESISTPLAWLGIAAFAFQLYFDFYGYSVMAQGMGTMLGFRIPRNFNAPYLSRSMTEFWRRWHITLGSWFREYVYIPLGGNRRGTLITIRNLLIVWVLTGLWHGAGYNYLLWGVTLGVLMIGEKFLYGEFLQKHALAGHLYMGLMIPVTWTIFAVEDLHQMGIYFSKLFPFWGQTAVFAGDFLKYGKLYWPFFLAAILLSVFSPTRLWQTIRKADHFHLAPLMVFCACLYCVYRGFNDPFLYFRF